MKEKDAKVIHNLFAEFHYADDLGVIKSKLVDYLATVRKEVETEYALCRQVQKRGQHSSVVCQCVVTVEESLRKEARQAAFKDVVGIAENEMVGADSSQNEEDFAYNRAIFDVVEAIQHAAANSKEGGGDG